MHEPKDYHSIVILFLQREKDKYHMVSLIYGSKKWIQMNFYKRQKQTHRHRKQTYGYQRGGEEGDKLRVWG